jgi:glycosyltransferase involved in cell wall biosynthesis
VIPVFNGGRFLAEAIESALAQDYAPFEVVVVDDGSTDGSLRVARSFPSVRSLHQANRGPGAARNTGVAAANGTFVSFLDADDVIRPTKISSQVTYLDEHPSVGCVLTQQELRCDPGVTLPSWVDARATGDPGAEALPTGPPVAVASALVRRSLVDPVGWFDPTFRLSEDMDWLMRLRNAGVEIGILDEPLLIRRVHGENISYETAASQGELLRAVRAQIARRR